MKQLCLFPRNEALVEAGYRNQSVYAALTVHAQYGNKDAIWIVKQIKERSGERFMQEINTLLGPGLGQRSNLPAELPRKRGRPRK